MPVINKIDLPAADVERAREEIDADLGLDPFAAIPVSAKTGVGIEDVLAGIVEHLPPPKGDPDAPLKALVFDAYFDKFRGVILQVPRDGGNAEAARHDPLHACRSRLQSRRTGLQPIQARSPKNSFSAGEVGYVVAGVKSVQDIEIGDTITLVDRPADRADSRLPSRPSRSYSPRSIQ